MGVPSLCGDQGEARTFGVIGGGVGGVSSAVSCSEDRTGEAGTQEKGWTTRGDRIDTGDESEPDSSVWVVIVNCELELERRLSDGGKPTNLAQSAEPGRDAIEALAVDDAEVDDGCCERRDATDACADARSGRSSSPPSVAVDGRPKMGFPGRD